MKITKDQWIVSLGYTVLIVVLVISVRIFLINDLPKKIVNVNTRSLQTGDLLISSFGHLPSRIMGGLLRTSWAHSALIVRKGGNVYVLEAARYSQPYVGCFIMPLGTWMRIHSNDLIIGVMRYHGPILDPDHILDVFKENYVGKIALDQRSWSWYRFLSSDPYQKCVRKRMTCHEVIMELLMDIGVVRKLLTCDSYLPWDLPYGKVKMEHSIYYSPVEEITHSISV